MVTSRKAQLLARSVTVFVAMGAISVLAAAPAFAASTVDITSATSSRVEVDYSCDAAAGVTSLQVMAGAPNAERPAAQGSLNTLTCDGTQRFASVSLSGASGAAPLQPGEVVQVRVALVGRDDVVVSGQAKLLNLE